MSKNIEDLFKESLENHILPYDHQAWVSFEKRLPQTKSSFAKWAKWGLAAATLVGGLSIYMLTNNSSSNIQKSDKVSTKTVNKSKVEKNNAENVIQQKTESINKPEHSTNLNPSPNVTTTLKISNSGVAAIPAEDVNHSIVSNENSNKKAENLTPVLNATDKIPNRKPQKIQFPVITEKCVGESVSIHNTNDQTIYLKEPNGMFIAIEPSEKIKLIVKESGTYGFVSQVNEKSLNNFTVRPGETFSVQLDNELTYENGLPIVKANVDVQEGNIQWLVNGKIAEHRGKNVQLTLFNKGRFEVVAQVQSANGCISESYSRITVPTEYNLLAVNAFDPYSSNLANKTFMPFALKSRQTPFKMTIIDPDNGAVIFESSDSSNEWDGTDIRTGKMVSSNKAYIWKVNLSKPERGEKSLYSGTIVRM